MLLAQFLANFVSTAILLSRRWGINGLGGEEGEGVEEGKIDIQMDWLYILAENGNGEFRSRAGSEVSIASIIAVMTPSSKSGIS